MDAVGYALLILVTAAVGVGFAYIVASGLVRAMCALFDVD